MKHYEFTGEKMEFDGRTLRRICATVDFDCAGITIEAGTVGGWIEKEANLEQESRAWVCGDARVYGNALVYGNAHYLCVGPIGSRDDTTTFTRDRAGEIFVSCGCFYGTLAEFRAQVAETHGDSKHARAYLAAADLAEIQIDTTPIDEEEHDDE